MTVDGGKRGVYLRQLEEVSKKTQWAVTVKPVLHDDVHNDRRVSVPLITSYLESGDIYNSSPGILRPCFSNISCFVHINCPSYADGVRDESAAFL